jgi:hypothetical protein
VVLLRPLGFANRPRHPGTRAKLQPIAAFPYPSSMLAILFDCQLAPMTRTTTKDEDDLRTGDGQSGIARIVQLYPQTYRAAAARLPVLQQSPKRVPSSEPSLRPDLQCPVMISFYSIICDRKNSSRFGKSKPLGKRTFQDFAYRKRAHLSICSRLSTRSFAC